MGGSIAVTLREPDGKEHRMLRWTNTLPEFVESMAFIRKEQKHIEKYLKQWYLMKEDWEYNKKAPPFAKRYAYPMTATYAPYPYGLVPGGYGLVVIDMKNNVILSAQEYTELGHMSVYKIYFDRGSAEKSDCDDPFTERTYCQAKKFMKEHRGMPIYIEKRKKGAEIQYKEREMPQKSFEEFMKDIDKDMERKGGARSNGAPWELRLDLTPFRIHTFEAKDPIRQWKSFKKEMKKLNFILTNEEDKQWGEYIALLEKEKDR